MAGVIHLAGPNSDCTSHWPAAWPAAWTAPVCMYMRMSMPMASACARGGTGHISH